MHACSIQTHTHARTHTHTLHISNITHSAVENRLARNGMSWPFPQNSNDHLPQSASSHKQLLIDASSHCTTIDINNSAYPPTMLSNHPAWSRTVLLWTKPFFCTFTWETIALSGIHRTFFAMRHVMRHAMRRDLRRTCAMRTREIPFTEEVSDAKTSC